MVKITKIKKRDGRIVDFDQQKITNAIFKAITATNQGDGKKSKKLSDKVAELLDRRFKKDEIPHVEQVQDIVEEALILEGLVETAKAYILYREQRRKIREAAGGIDESLGMIDKYIKELDWQVYENANMAYSLQGLNYYGVGTITKKYWLNRVYPKEIREALESGDFHIHDLDNLSTYCCGWDLYDLLLKGFGGVSGKVESKPAKHFRSALGQLVNFFYTLQGECYSKDTQVLTESGWKFFYEVTKENKVFSLNNQTNKIELQKPIRFYEFDYDGELYNFKSKKLDLLVTPNHNMVVDQYCPNCKKGTYCRKFVKAKDFNPNEHFIPKAGIWTGVKEEAQYISSLETTPQISLAPQGVKELVTVISGDKEFLLPEIEIQQYRNFAHRYKSIKIEAKKILMEDWLVFFGFWLAEGCTYQRERNRRGRNRPFYEYAVRISQNKGKTAEKFEEILKKLPFNYNKKDQNKKIEFVIGDKQLFSYLRQFGKAGDKFIPQEIKNLAKEQLKILFDWMMKGDGYVGNGNIEYSTKSKKLADDVQEIILKLGWSANIYKRHKEKFQWYDVGISRAKHFRFSSREKNIKKIEYQGKVYCLEVPNHTLYVRRNDKACWCGNSAGAQAISSFDTLLAPFIRYDNLSYRQVKQALQEFLFNMAIPTRVGFQTPFSNITIDIKPSPSLAKQPVIIGGKPQKEIYGEFQEEMGIINRALYEGLMEGDAKGRPFTFPIPTVNITKDFDWDDPNLDPLWEATAKYGVNYFANFIHSDMKPEDTRSMCCRLRLDNRELYKRGGGLFGSNPLTGSIGVVTINMPRLGYLSKTKKEFFERLAKLMDLTKESLEIKRKALENFMEKGLYPYSKHYLSGIRQMRSNYWSNHFSTIGLIGVNEALLNFIGENIGSRQGRRLAVEILDFMREKLVGYQKETGNLYNLEATPAEGASYRLALKDKEKYPDIITAGEKEPYYTNSVQLPVNYTDDLFEVLKLQDEIQTKFTGGTVVHLFLGERISDIQTTKNLVKKVFENFKLPYITITPTFSICPVHGYLSGEHFECPKCTVKQPCEVYSRVVGYLRPIQQWHPGKKEEFRQRKEYKVPTKI